LPNYRLIWANRRTTADGHRRDDGKISEWRRWNALERDP
jgi:hypothetical protein